ncbi:hypothetical protein CLAFUW4_10573 [Fulvia fulva]|uniref:Uncharacterized protein n=1 Tax=Passalora fulva TaxID=5499 RepID=A0A9Q8LGK5_PASFU|nr:uncharacterized protein CLAFUR5_05188 [Fulvia fulva]KAK4615774.1 hypothetical protein CLAFUR4_10578 [Fulvia fulva]KAK4617245.1 hypothetical protein CLAFUR0_10666 [Fulvia fulva]UJO16238.1 hypothetical protein CLAFUR5_05188 [Fulvia fulva]WPV19757.1 hypothetical protein CLAFUW4_10573 [Fulvia fulva]WPV34530.1 hypothetical protein CLAFUW7_10575 [Fulvia fulva]
MMVAITSRNAGSVRTRTVASALYNMSVQLSNIISSQIYRENDKPLYRTGNKVLLAVLAYNVIVFIATKLFYVHTNRKRDEIWSAMNTEEKEEYLRTTRDQVHKRLDFRFAH